MKNNTQVVVGYRISQLDRPFDLKPNQAKRRKRHRLVALAGAMDNTNNNLNAACCNEVEC